MDLFLLRVFPVFLMLGAVALVPIEFRSLRREKERGQPRYLKFYRRILGAVVLFGLAVMVFFGEVPQGGAQAPAVTMAQFHHWLTVLGLACFLMCLAIWDTIDGVRHLRRYLDTVEREEVRRIQEHLGGAARPDVVRTNGKK